MNEVIHIFFVDFHFLQKKRERIWRSEISGISYGNKDASFRSWDSL